MDTKLGSTIERLMPIFSDASQLAVGGRSLAQPVCCRVQYGRAANWGAYSKASMTLHKKMLSLRLPKGKTIDGNCHGHSPTIERGIIWRP